MENKRGNIKEQRETMSLPKTMLVYQRKGEKMTKIICIRCQLMAALNNRKQNVNKRPMCEAGLLQL